MNAAITVIIILSALLFGTACGDCTGSPGRIEKKSGEELPFEEISLGIDKRSFVKQALTLSKLENVDITIENSCREQLAMSVPDLDEKTMVERPKDQRPLSNCVVRTNIAAQSTSLLELRGEFIDNRLARLSFRLKPSEFSKLEKNIEGRFGPGAKMVLSERFVIEDKNIDYHIWQEDDEIWLLSRGETGTALFVHQDLKISKSLTPPPKDAKRGEPVSLEDLGIGKLDLNAPMPKLDLPDSGQ